MRIVKITAKSCVTAYGSYTKGQVVQLDDAFALHLIQNNLAEEVAELMAKPELNKSYMPQSVAEKKPRRIVSNTGTSNPSGLDEAFSLLDQAQASQTGTYKPLPDKR